MQRKSMGRHGLAMVVAIWSADAVARPQLPDWAKAAVVRYGLEENKGNSPNDREIQVAFAFCIVTLAAQGREYDPPDRRWEGAWIDCIGASTWDSVWRSHIREVLPKHGLASAFTTLSEEHWAKCTAAMLEANPTRIREGQAFERYCLPAAKKPGKKPVKKPAKEPQQPP